MSAILVKHIFSDKRMKKLNNMRKESMNIEFSKKQIIIMNKYFYDDFFKISSIKDAKIFSEAFKKIEKAHMKIMDKKSKGRKS